MNLKLSKIWAIHARYAKSTNFLLAQKLLYTNKKNHSEAGQNV